MATSWLYSSTSRHLSSLTKHFSLQRLLQISQRQTTCSSCHVQCRHCCTTKANGSDVPEESTQVTSVAGKNGKDKSSSKFPGTGRHYHRKLHDRVLSGKEKEADKQLLHSYETISDEDIFGKRHERRKNLSQITKKSGRPYDIGFEESQQFTRQHGIKSNKSGENVLSFASFNEFSQKNIGDKSKQLDRSWSETFGTLDGNGDGHSDTEASPDEKHGDDEDDVNFRRLSAVGRAHIPYWYGQKIEQFGKQGKIKEAIAVLDDWMLKRDRVMPNSYIFTTLIGVLGRVGYTKKAFKLFNQMKKMGFQPVDHTYTALFNACSNSPWLEDGLSRAINLRQLMLLKDYMPNMTTYKAMIKAFGICGDLQTAFSLMDELATNFKPDNESFSFLLMACIADKESGFEHAIKVWIMMKKYRITPDLPLFNLLLRSVRDCGVGDADFIKELLQSQTNANFNENILIEQSDDKLHYQLTSVDTPKELSSGPKQKTKMELENSPNLQETDIGYEDVLSGNESDISDSPTTMSHSAISVLQETDIGYEDILSGNESDISDSPTTMSHSAISVFDISNAKMLSLDDMKKPEHRLAVIGGMSGFLTQMEKTGATPDLRTFSQLLDIIPPTMQAENELMSEMDMKGITPDVDLFNMLIHKRCMRFDYEDARSVLELIARHNMCPNMRTFGCVAMTCKKMADGMQLLKDMENMGLSPNLAIFSTLIRTSNMDFFYKLVLLKEMSNFGIEANQRLLKIIERNIADARTIIVLKEKKKTVKPFYNAAYFEKGYEQFQAFYQRWLQETSFSNEEHPWQPFRQELK